MSFKRLTKETLRKSPGILNPLGHVLVAFKDDPTTDQAVLELRELGFTDADILRFPNDEATPRLRERIGQAGGGHGFEITLMRRYLAFSEKGAGWLLVFAPSDTGAQLITNVAKRLRASCAVRYHDEGNEDLIF
jgi:hypothetical protein